MLNGLNSVLTIFIMIGTGFILAKKGFFTKGTSKLFSQLVIKVSLPLMMVVSIPMRFSKEKLIGSASGILVAFSSIIITYILAIIIARIFRVEKSKRGVFYAMFAFSNSIFIGLPINVSLFGEESATYVFLFYLANTSLFWTLAVYNIRKTSSEVDKKFSKMESIKKIFSPPLISFIVGLTLVFLEIQLPSFIVSSFRYIGNLTTPLSMFFIGIVIYSIDFKEIKLDVPSYLIIAGRFIIAPFMMYLCLKLFELPNILNNVFIVEATMPIITQAALVSEFYGVNSKYVSFMVGFTTVLSILIIPIYSFILIK
ncbi:AEC family transporter [Wukongibacter baidiensis]|uniref:AEC family transporter n=1 Tax=Wukongibacter baidiensis TaxID=1723361 RepID=UPI003D7F20A5